MKIALLGYGKMGKAIEQAAVARGHEIVFRKKSDDGYENLKKADIAIECSVPSAAVGNLSACLTVGIPVVCGTTGWLADYEKIAALCKEKSGAFLYASNFSLGVNLFFNLNEYLARLMRNFPHYKVAIEEIHHTQKLDAPSGTAITLAQNICMHSNYTGYALTDAKQDIIPIAAKRIEHVPGTHSIYYQSAVDTIEIRHTAHSREGFAEGAVIAAEWLVNKKGVFSMKDVLEIDSNV
jgi:4-hydroxy-tetrahydrodipicolinate reductase